MVVDIDKLEGYNVLRLKFPSRTKAKKFVRCLVNKHNYEVPETTVIGLTLMIYKKTVLTTNTTNHIMDYLLFVIPEVKESKSRLSKFLSVLSGSTYYITKDILDSDLALRYYFYFYHRADYSGKWFVKCKKTKQYLEITEKQAQKVSDEMCGKNEFVKVLGCKTKHGFKRVYIYKDGKVESTLNGKVEQNA